MFPGWQPGLGERWERGDGFMGGGVGACASAGLRVLAMLTRVGP